MIQYGIDHISEYRKMLNTARVALLTNITGPAGGYTEITGNMPPDSIVWPGARSTGEYRCRRIGRPVHRSGYRASSIQPVWKGGKTFYAGNAGVL